MNLIIRKRRVLCVKGRRALCSRVGRPPPAPCDSPRYTEGRTSAARGRHGSFGKGWSRRPGFFLLRGRQPCCGRTQLCGEPRAPAMRPATPRPAPLGLLFLPTVSSGVPEPATRPLWTPPRSTPRQAPGKQHHAGSPQLLRRPLVLSEDVPQVSLQTLPVAPAPLPHRPGAGTVDVSLLAHPARRAQGCGVLSLSRTPPSEEAASCSVHKCGHGRAHAGAETHRSPGCRRQTRSQGRRTLAWRQRSTASWGWPSPSPGWWCLHR